MNNKENLINPIKMFWQDVPVEDNKIKNVLPTGAYCEPSNIMNSTHVHVEAKPWLQKTKLKKKENKASIIPQTKQTISKSKPNNGAKEKISEVNKNINTNKINDRVTVDKEQNVDDLNKNKKVTACSLAELCKEDKQRVADLVREMAKFSEEKETAVQQLTHLKTNFTVKLKSLEAEKQKMINEQDQLKEKLLRYELILKEIKDKQKTDGRNQVGVETILNNHVSLQESSVDYEKVKHIDNEPTPQTFPGNVRETKHSNNNIAAIAETQSESEEKQCSGGEQLKDMTDFADLFFKQQDKFHQQQEILQKQIEQLQKLQESILEQQQQHLKEVQGDTKTRGNQVQQENKISCGNQVQMGDLDDNPFDELSKGKYSIKLQNYISKQPKFGNTAIASTKKVNGTSHILASDTLMDDESLISVNCLNATSKSSKVDSAVQTVDNVPIQTVVTESKRIKSKEDVCLQTDTVSKDVPVSKKKVADNVYHLRNQDEMNRLKLCENHISKLEETLKDMSSKQLVPNANIDKSTDGKPKLDKHKKFTADSNTHKEISMIDDNYDHDIDDDIQDGKKDNSVNSALQRGHFQPASILELIDGLQPPSASTSIDHQSFKKMSPTNRKISRRTPLASINQESSHRTLLSPSNRQVKAKVRNEQSNKLQKVYGALKIKQNYDVTKQRHKRSSEDQEEQKMLSDVFFVR